MPDGHVSIFISTRMQSSFIQTFNFRTLWFIVAAISWVRAVGVSGCRRSHDDDSIRSLRRSPSNLDNVYYLFFNPNRADSETSFLAGNVSFFRSKCYFLIRIMVKTLVGICEKTKQSSEMQRNLFGRTLFYFNRPTNTLSQQSSSSRRGINDRSHPLF